MTFDEYVGLPFVEGGRDRTGIDCWGLLALVLLEHKRIVLPSFSGTYTLADHQATADLIAGNMGPWREIVAGCELPYDGLLMADRRSPSHIGLIIGNGRVLHIERGAGSIIEPYNGLRLRRRLMGFYRHASL